MAKHITARQQEVLDTIKEYIDQNEEPPTLKELRLILGIKTKRGVAKHLEALERKDYIYRTGEARGIKIVDRTKLSTLDIPILGYANAGTPLVYAEEDVVGFIQVDKSFVQKSAENFGLIIKGDSMNMREINRIPLADRNYIVVQKDSNYKDGDVVLAVVDGSATIKTYKKSHNSVILYPESDNPVHTPIYLRPDNEGFINGKVVAVLENPIN